jgi:hypothetical protein
VAEAPHHPLASACGLVLGGAEVGIGPEAIPLAVDRQVERQTLGEALGTGPERAGERGELRQACFPRHQRRLPGVVGGEQAAEVPGVGGGDGASLG